MADWLLPGVCAALDGAFAQQESSRDRAWWSLLASWASFVKAASLLVPDKPEELGGPETSAQITPLWRGRVIRMDPNYAAYLQHQQQQQAYHQYYQQQQQHQQPWPGHGYDASTHQP